MYKVTEEAGDIWEAYQGNGVPLWQIQLEHAAVPSVTYKIRDNFNEFLRDVSEKNKSCPTSLQDLEQGAGARLVVTDRSDPEDVGFVQWRPAFYVAGDLNNFLLLLDAWFVHKESNMAQDQPFEVHLYPHVSVDIATPWEDLEYKHYSRNDPAADLPLSLFEAQPVVGRRIVVFNIQTNGPNEISIVITGNTWSFRSRLDAFGIQGAYLQGEGDKRTYVRVLKAIDVSEESQQLRMIELLGAAVFNNLAIKASVDEEPEADTAVAAFLERLRAVPSLHFAKAASSIGAQ